MVENALVQLLESPVQTRKFDERLVESGTPIAPAERVLLYQRLAEVLGHGPSQNDVSDSIGLCLGHIQSGKTTAMTALCAMAADEGYSMVVAVLGSTNLLLSQNSDRMKEGLGISDDLRGDYSWFQLEASQLNKSESYRVRDAVESERCVLVTVLKNSRRLSTLATILSQLDFAGKRVLIVDDEADQASLNTKVQTEAESATYSELNRLCEIFSSRLYVQFTATPYAPLLIDPDDSMSPDFVAFLETGSGYTGAREFFIDNAEMVVRRVPGSETPRKEPHHLALGLRSAFASFVVGAAVLLSESDDQAPVSMLVHPTNRVAIHERVATLLRRCGKEWHKSVRKAEGVPDLPAELRKALHDLVAKADGRIAQPENDSLLTSILRVLSLLEISVVNGQASQDGVDWSKSPAHVLVGGNKLDRGFTVEGLTVTYMSRNHSPQLDTLVQRARAFGYRSGYLPYCRFYSNSDTIEAFEASVLTDEVLRSELEEWVKSAKPLSQWPARSGFLLSDGMRPTRSSVAPTLRSERYSGWHFLTLPSLDGSTIEANFSLLDELGLMDAQPVRYGRLRHRTLMDTSFSQVVSVIEQFEGPGRSNWHKSGLIKFLGRLNSELADFGVPVLLLESTEKGKARRRRWITGVGFSNLMQGRDKAPAEDGTRYVGDRELLKGRTQLQVHHLVHPLDSEKSLLTLALKIAQDIPNTTEVRR